MNALGRADRTLALAGLLASVVGLLIMHAERDLERAREQVLAERNKRIDAEDAAEKARTDLDGALEALHDAKGEPDSPAA